MTTAARVHGHRLDGLRIDVHGFPFLTQLAGGSLDDVSGSLERATFGGHEVSDVSFQARGVELGGALRADAIEVDGLVTFTTLASALSTQLSADVGLEPALDTPGAARLTLEVLGLDVGAVVTPSVAGPGLIGLRLDAVSLGALAVDPGALPGGIGDALGGLTVPLDLPRGVELTSVQVEGSGLRASLEGHGIALADIAS